MKKTTLSIIAAVAMNTFAFAGGDISPVEPQVTVPEVSEESTGSFYVGAGYSYMNLDADVVEHNGDEALLLAGYNFNQYVAVEARYAGFTDCLENYGIYVKPQYPFGAASVYALLGYGETTYDNGVVDHSEDGFQWGLGANYAVTENIGVFADYTSLYDDTFAGSTEDVTVDAINVGVTYTF
ncbi:MAG TPA: porin family protein [Sulfurovum sp.]|nr:porin family protein [Sulfurovum sp.]